MITPSSYEVNEKEWLKPFSTIIEDETTLYFADSCYMQMVHYDENFKDLEPRISGDYSMISSSYSFYSREADCTEDSSVDI